jgi:hypothetical protein
MHLNDAGGYDLIVLPSGGTTRVFTKEEFRLGADGSAKPPQTERSKPKRLLSKLKPVKKGEAAAAGKSGVEGSKERVDPAVAPQSHASGHFGKDSTGVSESCSTPHLGRDGLEVTRASAKRRGRAANKALATSK